MLNQSVLVGRIKEIHSNNIGETEMTVSVPRSFKNENGEYENDNLRCIIFKNIAATFIEYCKVGDLVGIKGRLQEINDVMKLVAEKITFLSNNNNNENH